MGGIIMWVSSWGHQQFWFYDFWVFFYIFIQIKHKLIRTSVEINRANIRVHWLRTAVWLTQEWPYCRNQEASGYRLCTTLPHSSLLLTPHYSFLLTPHSSSILITPHSLLILALLNPPFSSFTCVVIPPHSFSLFLIPLSPSFALTFSPYYFLSLPVFG